MSNIIVLKKGKENARKDLQLREKCVSCLACVNFKVCVSLVQGDFLFLWEISKIRVNVSAVHYQSANIPHTFGVQLYSKLYSCKQLQRIVRYSLVLYHCWRQSSCHESEISKLCVRLPFSYLLMHISTFYCVNKTLFIELGTRRVTPYDNG